MNLKKYKWNIIYLMLEEVDKIYNLLIIIII